MTFSRDLIPIIGGVGMVLMLIGFSARDFKAGPPLMGGGMIIVLATIAYKVYFTL